MVRRFKGVQSIDDYFNRQAQLRIESQQQFAALADISAPQRPSSEGVEGRRKASGSPSPEARRAPSIFVVMPFTEGWSPGTYDFIQRAVPSLAFSDAWVIRADTITDPGKIDQQIMKAIYAAEVVVGDISGINANVMWELGFAKAAKRPIFILNQRIEESPFDLANTRQVPYRLAPTDEDEKKLTDHIQSALNEDEVTQ